VMSDWGAVHSVDAANKGLDQESGQQLDKQVFFAGPLKAAVESGQVLLYRYNPDLAARGQNPLVLDSRPPKIPVEQYTIVVEFGCDPDRTSDLVKRVFQEIDAVKNGGVSEAQLRDVRAGLVREFETRSKTNAYLLGQISLRYQYQEDLKEFFNLPAVYNAITPAMIQEAAKAYLNTNNYVEVTLFPEKKVSGTRQEKQGIRH